MTFASQSVGTNRWSVVSNKFMRISPLVFLGLSCVALLPSQERPSSGAGSGSFRPFVGTWKGVCADGKDFVILTFTQVEGAGLEGTVRLANMRGGDDGDCATVVDPPSEKHALTVTDTKLSGSTLTFKGSKRMEFEMSVQTADNARLKFIGTASEDNPWKLKRTK
ncbi:MAG: hypothetical protein K2X35_22960 [Bryobacteraceae bacterium]|nr:hypothetical protein [Bryobacteraceae bacterium]